MMKGEHTALRVQAYFVWLVPPPGVRTPTFIWNRRDVHDSCFSTLPHQDQSHFIFFTFWPHSDTSHCGCWIPAYKLLCTQRAKRSDQRRAAAATAAADESDLCPIWGLEMATLQSQYVVRDGGRGPSKQLLGAEVLESRMTSFQANPHPWTHTFLSVGHDHLTDRALVWVCRPNIISSRANTAEPIGRMCVRKCSGPQNFGQTSGHKEPLPYSRSLSLQSGLNPYSP